MKCDRCSVPDTRRKRPTSGAQCVLCAARCGCGDRKSTRLNSSHQIISYAVFCLKKKKDRHSEKQWLAQRCIAVDGFNRYARRTLPYRYRRVYRHGLLIFALLCVSFLFFFNDTATTEIYTLSLHDALPI